jgi:hypothetical protein
MLGSTRRLAAAIAQERPAERGPAALERVLNASKRPAQAVGGQSNLGALTTATSSVFENKTSRKRRPAT